jgi:hypothetical protein
MAFCPNCSHRAPITTILQLEPGEAYHCAWCNTSSILDPKRFHLAASATAVLFLLFPVVAYLVFRSLGGIVSAIVLWTFLSPFAYVEWVTLRLVEQTLSQQDEAHREPRREAALQEEE